MKKFLGVLIILLTILNLSTIVLAENESTESYDETKNSIDLYIDSQLSKINIEEMEKYIRDDVAVKSVGLKDFVKNLISGKSNILDLFDKEKIQSAVFSELKTSLRVVAIILVLALLSSILKSLENSFSSGDISKITTYIIFITMVSLTLIGFKDVLNICYNTIDNTIGLMQVVMPILITLLVLIGFPITSTALNPIFLGGVTLINIVFKKFMFLSITIAFAILIINNLSQSIKLKKLSSFIKNINIVTIGAIFTIYLGLVSIQGMYVTSFDKFSVKTAKFAIGNFIPVVGGFVSDSMDILLSSTQLIKNVFGGIGLVLIIGICLIPIIKVLSVVIV